MKTLREQAQEIINNYSEEELKNMFSNRQFIAFYPDGSSIEIDKEYDEDDDPDDVREQMSDFLDNLEYGFFDDEPESSIMADIINHDVIWQWGADPALLESYDEKIGLLESLIENGWDEKIKDKTNKYDWDDMTARLDINRQFSGKIYSTGGYNEEQMTFIIDWNPTADPRQDSALYLEEIDELIETINDPDSNTLFWSTDRGLIHGDEARTAALEWIDKHDITEQWQRNTNAANWQDITSRLGLHASYNEYVYYTGSVGDYQALITVTADEE